jgi:hypothetical protein
MVWRPSTAIPNDRPMSERWLRLAENRVLSMQDESKHAVGCYPQGERASFRWPGGPTLADRSGMLPIRQPSAADSENVARSVRGRPIGASAGRRGPAGSLRYCLAGVTRQIVLDRSSATISAPRPSTVTPTGRPRVLPSSPMKPARKSTGGPDGRPLLNGTKTTL